MAKNQPKSPNIIGRPYSLEEISDLLTEKHADRVEGWYHLPIKDIRGGVWIAEPYCDMFKCLPPGVKVGEKPSYSRVLPDNLIWVDPNDSIANCAHTYNMPCLEYRGTWDGKVANFKMYYTTQQFIKLAKELDAKRLIPPQFIWVPDTAYDGKKSPVDMEKDQPLFEAGLHFGRVYQSMSHPEEDSRVFCYLGGNFELRGPQKRLVDPIQAQPKEKGLLHRLLGL
jgi:hypothetical protein